MGQTTTSVPQKGLWVFSAMDWVKGLGIALGTSILAIGTLIIQNHWKIPTFAVLEPYLDTIGYGFLAYVGKGLSTNNVGQLFQKDKPVVHIGVDKLAELEQKAAVVSNDLQPISEDAQPLNDDLEVKKN